MILLVVYYVKSGKHSQQLIMISMTFYMNYTLTLITLDEGLYFLFIDKYEIHANKTNISSNLLAFLAIPKCFVICVALIFGYFWDIMTRS